MLLYLQLGSLPWQNASSDADGAKLKKATSVEQLCRTLPVEWRLMLTHIRACGFEAKPEYAFFEKQFGKLGGKLGLLEPFNWGGQKAPKGKPAHLKMKVSVYVYTSICLRFLGASVDHFVCVSSS